MLLREFSCTMVPLLLLHLLLLTSSGEAAATIDWLSTAGCGNSSAITCACDRIGKSLLNCQLISGHKLPIGSIACSDARADKMSQLDITCQGFSHCAVLQLFHLAYNTTLFHLRVSYCQLYWSSDSRLLTSFSLISDGRVSLRGVAGFLYTESNNSAAELASHRCSLRKLLVDNTELKFPASLLYNCPLLKLVKIAQSRLLDLTDEDVLAMSITSGLSITGCELYYFGDGLVSQMLKKMTQLPLRVTCINEKCINSTEKAKRVINKLVKEHSAITDVRNLYAVMDFVYLDSFRLLIGHKIDSLNMPSQLNNVDLSNNNLETIPISLSLLGKLEVLNLSRNRISYLYDDAGCWGGPLGGSPHAVGKSRRQCYWFRAARQSLKTLDLSHNRIEYLGQYEPWQGVKLWTLNLSNNKIKILSAESFSGSLSESLTYLSIDNNEIGFLELSCLSNLRIFSANNNNLTCIKNDTLPSSKALWQIRLAGNQINSIAPGVFKKYIRLRELDLSNNCLKCMPAASFETSPREATSDRVAVKISQKTFCPLECDCQHFFAKALLEEKSDDHFYTMPAVSDEERRHVKCRPTPRRGGSTFDSALHDLNPNDFVCQFTYYDKIQLPTTVCVRNGTACIGKCNPNCQCSANDNEMIMNCSVHGDVLSAKNIPLPITVLYFSRIRVSFFQAYRNSTLTWQHDRDRLSLREFHAYNSGIVSIQDYAFGNTPGVTKIYFSHNKIKTLTRHTFSGLETSLAVLTLDHNNLSRISVSIFRQMTALSRVTLLGNPFVCSCNERHLSYLAEMAEYSSWRSVITDYNELTCKLTEEFETSFNQYNLSQVYKNVSLSKFPLWSVDYLKEICQEIENRKSQLVLTIVKATLISIGTSAALVAAIVLIRRRHFVCSLVVLSFLTRVAGRRTSRPRSSKQYHLFVYCAEGNCSILENVLDTVTKASNSIVGQPVKVCTTCSFLIPEDPGSTQSLSEIESIELAIMRSDKVMVLLSEELFRTKTRELLVISQELGTRRLWKDLILMRLENSSDVAEQLSGSFESLTSLQERKAMEAWMKILMSNQTVLYGNLDWQYKLINLIFDGHMLKLDERLNRSDDELKPLIDCQSDGSKNSRGYSVNISA